MKLNNKYISSIDIGSSKITTLIAEIAPESKIPIILGYGISESNGVINGQVININETTEAIKKSVKLAEEMSGLTVTNCYATISGEHIRSMQTNGRIAISSGLGTGYAGESREIVKEDVDRILENASALPMPIDRDILHITPIKFIVDEHDKQLNPIGLSGRHMEVKVHLTTYSRTAADNLSRCIKNVGIEVNRFVLQSIASAYGALDNNEKKLGSVLIDIGSGTTDIIVYYNSGIYYTGVLSIGGYSVTNDLAYLLRMPLEDAELLKKESGCAIKDMADIKKDIKIKGYGGRSAKTIPAVTLAEYIEPRIEEIMKEVYTESQKADTPISETFSVVLTGGCTLLPGVKELTNKIFENNVRIGRPLGFKGYESELNSPEFTASIGLVKYAIKEGIINKKSKPSSKNILRFLKNLIDRFI